MLGAILIGAKRLERIVGGLGMFCALGFSLQRLLVTDLLVAVLVAIQRAEQANGFVAFSLVRQLDGLLIFPFKDGCFARFNLCRAVAIAVQDAKSLDGLLIFLVGLQLDSLLVFPFENGCFAGFNLFGAVAVAVQDAKSLDGFLVFLVSLQLDALLIFPF